MKGVTQEVAKGVTRVTGGICNFYVVEEGGSYTLVDAGAPGDWKLLLQVVPSIDRIEAILVTHAHSDHTGFAERARREAGTRVMIHQADAALAKGGKPPKNDGGIARYLLRAELWKTTFSLSRRGGVKIVPIAKVSTFGDGETLDLPGQPRVVHAPGHTAGTAAVYLEDRGVLCSSDALIMRNPMTGRTGPQIAADAFNLNSEQALQSLDILGAVPAETVLPGHGEPFTGGAAEAARLAKAAGRS
jgi:glyoxylase-like metal-dependent hydrolase (beta-lactamase superfamily II)